jgi:hypothetical protein
MGEPQLRVVESEPSPQAAAYVGHELSEASLAVRKCLGLLGWRSSDPPLEYQDLGAHKASRIGYLLKEANDAIQGAQDATSDRLGTEVAETLERLDTHHQMVGAFLAYFGEATAKLPAHLEIRRLTVLMTAAHGLMTADLSALQAALQRP